MWARSCELNSAVGTGMTRTNLALTDAEGSHKPILQLSFWEEMQAANGEKRP